MSVCVILVASLVHSLHVVTQIPSAGKAISGFAPFTTFEGTKVRVLSMSVESMGFSFMPKQASIGRKNLFLAFRVGCLALVRP